MISEDSIRKDRHWLQFIKTVLAESPQSGIGENAIYQKYKELYDSYEFSPAGYLRLGKNSRILSANLTTAFILGTYRSELIGKPLYAFVKRNDRDTLYLHLRRLFKEK